MISIKRQSKVKTLCICALLVAISAILANIKIFGSIAFDSMPAFLAGIIINPILGGIVGLLGHLFTALTSGFPLTIPIHLTIAIEMFITVYLFAVVYKKNKLVAVILAILLNGPISVFITGVIYSVTVGGMGVFAFFSSMVMPLTLAGTANILIAFAIGGRVKNVNI